MSLFERVNAALAGNPVSKDPETPWWFNRPYRFPSTVAIPTTKERVAIVAKDAAGTVYLAGIPYTEENRPRDSIWYFRRPVDVMSWAYCRRLKFRPEFCPPRYGRSVVKVEVYFSREDDECKPGMGVKFSFDTDGTLHSVRCKNTDECYYCGTAEFHKGSIDGVDRYGHSFTVEGALGYL